jgi:thiamine-monophosphate kinase
VLGSGDDAAITVRDGASATSVDALVEGVHFRIPPFSPRQVGHKALAVALSDLAAMGASAGEAYVQLGVPKERTEAELLELADGLAGLAATHGVTIAGCDLTAAPVLLVAVTVVGGGDLDGLVRRSGARAGDLVVVTGELGGAAAGLVLLEQPELGEALESGVANALRARQLEPTPLLAAGAALAGAGATAMIDLSDGLGADATHLARAGGVGLEIELGRLPIQAGVTEVARAAGIDPLDLASAGGEDYELLATVAPQRFDNADGAVAAAGHLTVIGEVTGGAAEVTLSGPDGPRSPAGYDQVRGRQAPCDPA